MRPSPAWRAHPDAGGVSDPLHGVGENLIVAIGGAMALGGEGSGDLDIGYTLASEIENSVAHFRPSRESVDGVDLHLDLKLGHGAATPDNSHQGDIVLTAVENDLVDQTPQQGFALSIGGGWIGPDLWEAASETDYLTV